MKIIAFTGMPYSGKSEAVKIAKDQGMQVIRMGEMIWEETKNQGLELNDKNVGEIANSMREKYGKDIWARRTVNVIKAKNKLNQIVIDGIRNIEEIEFFKKEFGTDIVIISINAPDELRKNRSLNRKRKDDTINLQNFHKRDKRELLWGLGNVIASADIIVSNEGSLQDFRNRIKELFQQL